MKSPGLNELETKTGVLPFKAEAAVARTYNLDAQAVGMDGFDAMLDKTPPGAST